MQEYELSPELASVVKEMISKVLGISFEEMFAVYQLEGENLTDRDLVEEILEAGGAQAEGDAVFEDIVTIGIIAIAGPLGLMGK